MKFSGFIKSRFNINKKNGLYLTIGTVVCCIFLFIFFNFFEDIIESSSVFVFSFDKNIINIIETIRSPFLNGLMAFITYMGNSYTICFAFLAVATLLILLKKLRFLYSLIVSIAGSAVFVLLIKNIIGRQRPPVENALIILKDYSFPSGHSYMAVAFYGLVAYFIYDLLKSKKARVFLVAFGSVFVLALGFSRLYLGVHWPSDVFAGFASALALITAIITILEIKERFQPAEKSVSGSRKKAAFIAGAIMIPAWIIYLVIYYLMHPLK
jgi:undecaprenyl-diphosphatase